MTWHDRLVWLLHLGADFEHALMVQYLYAAYSLGGKQVPTKYHRKVKEWQESILAVAREEMGHLLTVQNVLKFLGAGFSLSRDQFPWAIEWFNIEPFCMGSLACYVNAEMPEIEDFPEQEEIQELVKKHLEKNSLPVHPVAEIYRKSWTCWQTQNGFQRVRSSRILIRSRPPGTNGAAATSRLRGHLMLQAIS